MSMYHYLRHYCHSKELFFWTLSQAQRSTFLLALGCNWCVDTLIRIDWCLYGQVLTYNLIRGILSVIQKGFAERLQKTCWLLNCLLSNRFFLIFSYLYCVSWHLIYNWLFMHWWLYTLIHLVLCETHWGLISIQINKFHLNGCLRHWIYCICPRLFYRCNSNIIIVVYDVSVVDNTGFFSILRDRSRSWAKISKFELFRFLPIRWR